MIYRFQFRLRTLMLIVAIVAVQCAVCLPALKEWQRIEQWRRIEEALQPTSGGSIRYTVVQPWYEKPTP